MGFHTKAHYLELRGNIQGPDIRVIREDTAQPLATSYTTQTCGVWKSCLATSVYTSEIH